MKWRPGMPDPSQIVGPGAAPPDTGGHADPGQCVASADPAAVRSGEQVQVEVRAAVGRACASKAGRNLPDNRDKLDTTVRNPANGKIFRATVAARGRVTVAAGARDIGTLEAP